MYILRSLYTMTQRFPFCVGVAPTILTGPKSLNVSVNAEATFSCYMSDVHFAKWFLNGAQVESVNNLKSTKTSYPLNETIERYTINFHIQDTNVPILNYGLITCQGYYDNEAAQKFMLTSLSDPAILLIQGKSMLLYACLT